MPEVVINGGGDTPAAVVVSGEDANAATETAQAISDVEKLQDKTIDAAVTLEAATHLAEEEKQRHILDAARRADEHADEMGTIRRELEENRQWREDQQTRISELQRTVTEALETLATMLSIPATDTEQPPPDNPEAIVIADPETVAEAAAEIPAEESAAVQPVVAAPVSPPRRRFRLV